MSIDSYSFDIVSSVGLKFVTPVTQLTLWYLTKLINMFLHRPQCKTNFVNAISYSFVKSDIKFRDTYRKIED